MSLSLSLPLPVSLKSVNISLGEDLEINKIKSHFKGRAGNSLIYSSYVHSIWNSVLFLRKGGQSTPPPKCALEISKDRKLDNLLLCLTWWVIRLGS